MNDEREKCGIYVMSYADIDRYPISDEYRIVSCGSVMDGNYEVPLFMDNTGDNVSGWNKTMCEWTGIYWIWRNLQLEDYVGLNQQRRFFSFWNEVPDFRETLHAKRKSFVLGNALSMDATNEAQYRYFHVGEHLDRLLDAVHEFDSAYDASAREFLDSSFIFPSNLCVMERERFLDMCSFVFGVMDRFMADNGFRTLVDIDHEMERREFEIRSKRMRPNNTFEYQYRMYAYLAERLVNIFNIGSLDDALIMDVVETSSKYGGNIFKRI